MTAAQPSATSEHEAPTRNLIIDYYHRLPAVAAVCAPDRRPNPEPEGFKPGFDFPDLDHRTREFFSVAKASWRLLGDYRGRNVRVLDLASNPATQTTKTLASLLIVARAVEHIRRTGVPIMLVTPTSANKGTALRDAVLRAIDAGLVAPHELRVTAIAPIGCRNKLRRSRLADDAELRKLNPLLLYTGQQSEDVKPLAREFVRKHATPWANKTGGRLWFSLDLANYMLADAARAFFEHDVDPIARDERRIHAHAVSSAYGLLGYHCGRSILESDGHASDAQHPESFLIQHLYTPDMVLSLRFGGFDRRNMPRYSWDAATKLYRQDSDPGFPYATHSPSEILDPTFYTHRPPTSVSMNGIIERFGGGGIVVSLYECLQHWPTVRGEFARAGIDLPRDPYELTERSLMMAMTGVRHGVDRSLIASDRTIVVHASGTYAQSDYEAVTDENTQNVQSVDDVAAAVWTD